MNFLKKYKTPIIAVVAVLAVLLCAFFAGGSIPSNQNADTAMNNITETPMAMQTPSPSLTPDNTSTPVPKVVQTAKPEKKEKQVELVAPEQNKENTQTTAQSTPQPVVQEEETNEELTCTLSVKCDTILQNMELLTAGKAGLVPQSGTIFSERTVTFYEGESVFNLLVREMKRNGIHLEYVNVPMYNSAYIEGIANIYEFDCGELSGWMYRVNGYFPNYGCSTYQLKDGDRVEFVYTCDLGNDVGGGYSARNGI